jgi:hypothetical protein
MLTEFAGPYADWINVKTAYGAVGDGTTADASAFSTAGAAMTNGDVLYVPAGTYRMDQYISMLSGKSYVQIVGENPLTTIIQYDTIDMAGMWNIVGCNYSKISRLQFRGLAGGGNKAWALLNFAWNLTGPATTGNEISDCIFQDTRYGIAAGTGGNMDAECMVRRCRFYRASVAGFKTFNANALDWWFKDCYFEDCNVCLGNHDGTDSGAGNFHADRCTFINSTTSDIHLGNCEYFSVRRCTSYNSNRFFFQYGIGAANPITIQDCTVLDTVQDVAIDIGSPGPLTMVGTTIRSRVGATNYVAGAGNVVMYDNVYTSPGAMGGGHGRVFDNAQVARSTLTGLTAPGPVAFPPKVTRTIFNVPAGSSATDFQNAINSACAVGSDGSMSVVKLAKGDFPIPGFVTVPGGKRIQIIGNGALSRLAYSGNGYGAGWSGGGEPVLWLQSPSQVTIADIGITGNGVSGSGIFIENVDQPGARVYMDQLHTSQCYTSVFAEWCGQATIETHGAQASTAYGTALFSRGSRLLAFGGAHGSNDTCYWLDSGGELLIFDTWYEGVQPFLFNFIDRGTFVLWGSKIAADDPNHGGGGTTSDPSVRAGNHLGRVTLANCVLVTNNRISATGNRHPNPFLVMGCSGQDDPYIVGTGGAQSPFARVACAQTVSDGSANFIAEDTHRIPASGLDAFIRAQLALARTATPSPAILPAPTDAVTTDVRLTKVDVLQSVHAVWPRGALLPGQAAYDPATSGYTQRRILVVANAQKAKVNRILDRINPMAEGQSLRKGLSASGTAPITHWVGSLSFTERQWGEFTTLLAAEITANTVRHYDGTTTTPGAALTALGLSWVMG